MEAGCGSRIRSTWQRITVGSLCRGNHVGVRARRSRGSVPVVLRGIVVARRSQERRADGRARAAWTCASGASIDASFRGEVRVVRRGSALGGARPCPADHRTTRPDPCADHRRHRHPEERQALRRCGAAVLRATRQTRQLPGRGEPVGGQRPCEPADRVSPVSTARMV